MRDSFFYVFSLLSSELSSVPDLEGVFDTYNAADDYAFDLGKKFPHLFVFVEEKHRDEAPFSDYEA